MRSRRWWRVVNELTPEAALSRPQSPRLTSVTSDPFSVVATFSYPGRSLDGRSDPRLPPVSQLTPFPTPHRASRAVPVDVLTPLSKHLHDQRVPIYITPFALIEPGDPPPLGSNPFPVEGDWLASTRKSQRRS